MKILLLGRNGQVGWELQRALAPLGEITAPTRTEEGGLCGDLTRPDRLAATVRKVAPDVIVNAAAYTAVDQAESEPELAHAINGTAPEILAAEANALGAWLVHYSTDYVFDGTGADPWCEDDTTGPLNVYGQTKREGEAAIQASGCRHLIFRTSWVYASRGRNFIRTMLRLAAERDALQVIDDQFGAPTGAELIADTAAQILSQPLDRAEIAGLYHLAAAGETTWHGFARLVLTTARDAGWPVRVADQAIQAVSTEAFPTAARRPGNSRLNCSKLEGTFDLQLPDWRGGALRALDEILACEATGGRG
ncbi:MULTISPECIES: dTDP-4-dehydrorhamnose reductase [unclassified Thioalkalivibrio]|uniref:dTDP-4-dehydrorhamnose reductase n=1 Tax=unclassified Thioalkalivibrio TaxID=2621013 RepID=UPI000368EA7F|nr:MULTISPECIES: dTDP-4-dehydrorhamnose reductase [unclassified Thioalkalivibrio]